METFADIVDRISSVVATVPDPEIPVLSIAELGIVREIGRDTTGPYVCLTPTYSGCPATSAIKEATRYALDEAGLADVRIRFILTPAWSTSMISETGRQKLRDYGIAPPIPNATSVACPRCQSENTTEVSRFGSTPCKSLWRCNDCLEPFDHFKCH